MFLVSLCYFAYCDAISANRSLSFFYNHKTFRHLSFFLDVFSKLVFLRLYVRNQRQQMRPIYSVEKVYFPQEVKFVDKSRLSHTLTYDFHASCLFYVQKITGFHSIGAELLLVQLPLFLFCQVPIIFGHELLLVVKDVAHCCKIFHCQLHLFFITCF